MGNDLAAARPESVTPYLQGLRAALQYNLPDDPPEIPRGGINLIDRSPGGAENMRRAQLLQEARAKAAETAIRQGELIQMREILIGQVVFLYSRKPFATDEIRALATQVIADDHLVGRLMGAVEDAVNERTTTGGPGTPYMVKVIPKFLEPSQPADAQQPATAVTAKP